MVLFEVPARHPSRLDKTVTWRCFIMNTNIKKISLKQLLIVCAMSSLFSGVASAATVNGTFSFFVAFSQVTSGGTPIGVDFGDFPLNTGINPDGVFDSDISSATISATSGDFVGLLDPSILLKDFSYDLIGVPNPIATSGGFQFSMTSLTPPAVPGGGPGEGDFVGQGVLVDTINGFDPTLIDWTFNDANGVIAIVAIGAVGIAPVPLPAAFWLMLSSVSGLLLTRRARLSGDSNY